MRLNRILLKACANEPGKRYERAGLMHDDLDQLNGVKRKKGGSGLRTVAAVALMLIAAVLLVLHFRPKYQPRVLTTALIQTGNCRRARR